MKVSSLDMRVVVASMTFSVCLGLVLVWILSTLTEPAHADQRMVDVEHRMLRAQAALRAVALTDHYPLGAICPDAASGANTAKTMIETASNKTHVALSEAGIAPMSMAAGAMLSAFSTSISAHGQEADINSFLKELAVHPPMIIADAVDLDSNGQEVSLSIKGRFLCHDHRLP